MRGALVFHVVHTHCGHLLLNRAAVSVNHIFTKKWLQILCAAQVCINVRKPCGQTGHRVERSHIGCAAFCQDSLFGFRGNVSTRANADEGAATIANGGQHGGCHLCHQKFTFGKDVSIHTHHGNWQYVSTGADGCNFLQQVIRDLQA